ncbi:MAG: sigma-70 family RNA polymerase sigma factor [Akkermansiaceae bacterium]|nr:sigma-70 family RNA polymerase sigma factor [Akkermansiaceae bacterium]
MTPTPDSSPAADASIASLWLAEVWQQHKDRISHLLSTRVPPALLRRMGVEDLVQEAYLACGRRLDFLQQREDVPVYVKLRRIALQALADMERKHLGAGKRDAMKEADLESEESSGAMDAWAQFADSISSPRTHLERLERQACTRRVLAELPDTDREILELRHFEELSNAECAAVLGLSQKTASIRYVRALKRFRDLLIEQDNTL